MSLFNANFSFTIYITISPCYIKMFFHKEFKLFSFYALNSFYDFCSSFQSVFLKNNFFSRWFTGWCLCFLGVMIINIFNDVSFITAIKQIWLSLSFFVIIRNLNFVICIFCIFGFLFFHFLLLFNFGTFLFFFRIIFFSSFSLFVLFSYFFRISWFFVDGVCLIYLQLKSLDIIMIHQS